MTPRPSPPLLGGEGETGIRGHHAHGRTAARLSELWQDLHQRLVLAVAGPIVIILATATASTLATAFARAATPRGHWSCRGDGRRGFLALGDTDVLGDLVEILCVLHASLVLPLIHRHGELLLHLLTVDWPRVIGAEGIYQAVWRGVVDDATLHALHLIVIRVHEVHATGHEQLIALAPLPALWPPLDQLLQEPQEVTEGHTGWRLVGIPE